MKKFIEIWLKSEDFLGAKGNPTGKCSAASVLANTLRGREATWEGGPCPRAPS